ncbi:MAG: hypothetical protein DMF23_07925 [Verrucomicrobia bacterium]|nr:MAG: hypothetical protein DMF23_07925 [Verrucomicrobiota bacterium]
MKPELPENHNLLGLAYCRAERFEEGIAEYRKALELKESRASTAQSVSVATIRTNLANALTIIGNNLSSSATEIPSEATRRYEEAIAQYKKALELEPNQPAIHRNLGLLLARLGRLDEAEAHLRASRRDPSTALGMTTKDASPRSRHLYRRDRNSSSR